MGVGKSKTSIVLPMHNNRQDNKLYEIRVARRNNKENQQVRESQ